MSAGGERVTVVFFRTGYDSLGGGSKMLLRLLERLDRERFEPVLLTQREDGVARRAREAGVEVRVVPYRGVLDTYDGGLLDAGPRRVPRLGFRILQFNAEARDVFARADVLWCNGLRTYLTALPASLAGSAPVVWNIGLLRESTGAVRHLNRLALATTDYAFIESRRQARRGFTAAQYRAYREKLVVFHKGIDTEEFDPRRVEAGGVEASGADEGATGGADERASSSGWVDEWSVGQGEGDRPLRVGTAALINPRKGLDDLLAAARLLAESRDDVVFAVAGAPARPEDEAHLADLLAQREAYGLTERVSFLGWVEDVPSYLAGLDVFVLPSHNEGIPGAVREASAMELPVVATDVGGTADVVADGVTGLLVDPGEPADLAAAVERLLSNPDERRAMGERGRRRIVESFSLRSYVADYESFLARVA
ncbi:glycosyltransferase [Halomarina ordinaria]|uniref:Glycosyltransferase n=1 Tax=Halomarina ordinaria TaxID=3033939 RepID=A0ABD5U6A6_9EURY|nr:glycosyltransferase [Halomarina sp. PSRA2]